MRFLILVLITISFLPDWGIFLPGDRVRPILSLPEIGALIFIIAWFLRKVLNPNVQRKSLWMFFLVVGILSSASLGALLNLNYINIVEHFRSCVKLIFWGIFMFCWIDIVRGNLIEDKFPQSALRCYLNVAIVISVIAIFQYIFYYIFGEHIQLNPMGQRWGAIGGHYRATGIYGEPSWLGVILIPPFLIHAQLLYTKECLCYLPGFIVILMGIVVSLSLASFAVVGIWGIYILLKWIYVTLAIFLKPKVRKAQIALFFITCLFILVGSIVLAKLIYPAIEPRIKAELINRRIPGYLIEEHALTSGAVRLSSFSGFVTVLKHSPLFGVGFDQETYITSLGGKFFSYTGSGIIGFLGTSAGIMGICFMFFIFRIVWNAGNKAGARTSEVIQSNLVLTGRTIVVALLLEQLILYAGILNADFWLPLAFAYLFIKVGYGK